MNDTLCSTYVLCPHDFDIFVKDVGLKLVKLMIKRFEINSIKINSLPITVNLNSLSTNPTKWSNILKQFVGKLPKLCEIGAKRVKTNWRSFEGANYILHVHIASLELNSKGSWNNTSRKFRISHPRDSK